MAESDLTCGLYQTRGLVNLTNTCWFNSTLQCFAQTPMLLEELKNCANLKNQEITLPGGRLTLEDDFHVEVPSLNIDIDDLGPLTSELENAIYQLGENRYDNYNPLEFLLIVTEKFPQFVRYKQHDSHEFIRCLLEGMADENRQIFRKAIAEGMDREKLKNPDFYADENEKAIEDFYNKQAAETLTIGIEKIFRGTFQTIAECQVCKNSSFRKEVFFDLSLPIISSTDRKESESDEYKLEDDRLERLLSLNDFESDSQSLNNFIQRFRKEEDVESLDYDNIPDLVEPEEKPKIDFYDNFSDLSSYVSAGTLNEEDDQNNSVDSSELCEITNVVNENSPENLISQETLNGSSRTSDLDESVDRPAVVKCVANLSNHEAMLLPNESDDVSEHHLELQKSPNSDDWDFSDLFGKATEEEKLKISKKLDDEEDFDLFKSDENLGTEEYTLKSCLDKYFDAELLTGDNRVSCDICTEAYGTDNEEVLTDRTMKVEICDIPNIFIINLKRFQYTVFGLKKNDDVVTFPTFLDISPYCSEKCLEKNGNMPILYSLYAVTEHIGSLNFGHYISYRRLKTENNGNQGFRTSLPGQWLYTSDGIVKECEEDEVLNARPYILYYKRIF